LSILFLGKAKVMGSFLKKRNNAFDKKYGHIARNQESVQKLKPIIIYMIHGLQNKTT
jgi:hypothetical protein